MVRLVVSDVDGTLLPDSARRLDPLVIERIRRLMQKGIPFCPVSGRQLTSLRRLFQPLSSRMYQICENGAAMFGPGEPPPLLEMTGMDRAACLELSHQILAVPDFELIISGADTTYLCPKCSDLEEYIQNQLGNRTRIVNAPEEISERFLKVSAYCRSGGRNAEKQLAPAWRDRFQVAVAGQNWLDFTATDKGAALRKLCAILGVELEEVVAFGDNDNDLSMLEAVGHPYIVEGASPRLRERFPNRCCRVEEVLARL